MSGPDVMLFPLFCIALGVALAHLLCAHAAHYFGYRRGYLRLGYLLGLFGGPAGVLASVLLSCKGSPLLALEHELCYGTDDSDGEHWLKLNYYGLLAVFFLLVAVLMLARGVAPAEGVWFFVVFGVVLLALAGSHISRAQPPLYMLPPLPHLAGVGMQDMLEWIDIRHHAAVLKQSASLLWLVQVGAFTLAVICGLLGVANLGQSDSVDKLAIVTFALVPVFAALALWARSSSRNRRWRLEGMYYELFPDHEYGDTSLPEPEEFDARVRWRYERILRQTLGFSKSHAEHLAVKTEEIVENTRHSFFSKPLAAGVVIWLLIKSCHGFRLIERVSQSIEEPGGLDVESWIPVGVIAAVVVGVLLINWLIRRRRDH